MDRQPDPELGLPSYFWHTGQKKVERPACTICRMRPRQAARRHRLAFPLIGVEAILEIAPRTVGPDVVPEARSAGGNRVAENRPNRGRERRKPGVGAAISHQAAGPPARRKARPKESLADIDVAEAGDAALVEQGGLERRLRTLEHARQACGSRSHRQRLGAKPAQQPVPGELARRRQIHESEAPRIVVDDARAVIEVKNDMIMRTCTRGIRRRRDRLLAKADVGARAAHIR